MKRSWTFSIIILLNVFTSFGQERAIHVDNDGNVAIGGATYPQAKLSVSGQILSTGSGGNLSTPVPQQGAYIDWNRQIQGKTYFINNRGFGPGGFLFYNANKEGNIGSPFLTIEGNGNVAIGGVTYPNTKLSVSGQILSTGSGGNLSTPVPQQGAYIDWNRQIQGKTYFINQKGLSPTGGFFFYNASNDGKIEDDWMAHLYYRGDHPELRAILTVKNTISAQNIWEQSDKRFKSNLKPLKDCLPKIKNIKGYYFNWNKKGASSWKDIGLLAQEVEKEYPELVHEDENGYKLLDYSKFTAVLVEAIKEQQEIIEQQRKELKEIKSKLHQIEASLQPPGKTKN